MYRPEKPAPTTTASNWSGTEAGLSMRRSLVVPELGKGGALPLTLTQLHNCANALVSAGVGCPRASKRPATRRSGVSERRPSGLPAQRGNVPLGDVLTSGPVSP